ncbi:acyl-protein thioesterase [Verticillium alfalfae VaMs.102]|uniref:Acyl-protein thioesterase 1 n=1 Tax=Verticillium alfalfae (strain VaMs.102 / ATCC MYA-4576 / FGSC 10136) TaxID=526221 RepID=C9S9N8_VERA1|nr:acyl-protein thioesterase [Verticillium alfalfae VaMs.102]EEY16101.1 acyl-protein thioesterase [Verticillium alfalfae VaMs.102]
MASSLRRSAPLVFPAPGRHTATVIFAHGLGDTGHGWASAVESWRRRQRLDGVKFILPNAPMIPITVNGRHGHARLVWISEPGLTPDPRASSTAPSSRCARTRTTPASASRPGYFHGLIQAEVDAGIPSDRIVLGGFSQGGAMALFAGLTAPVKLGGIVGLSCWLLLSNKFGDEVKEEAKSVNRDTKVWMGHGGSDPLVRPELGQMSAEMLKKLGFDATLKIYPGMPHSACPEELDDVEAFLRERLPAQ